MRSSFEKMANRTNTLNLLGTVEQLEASRYKFWNLAWKNEVGRASNPKRKQAFHHVDI